MKQLELLSVKLCEKLPLDITLHEEAGICKKPSDECEYCIRHGNDYICHKKTYTLTLAN